MPFSSLFLDLDGTITDSMPGITNSVSHALGKFGITAAPGSLRKFVGPPLRESFRTYFPETFDENNVDDVIAEFKVRYAEKGVHELSVYPGMPEFIADLRAAGKTIVLATSKAEHFARQILEEIGLSRFFTFISGADYPSNRLSKAEVLRHALQNLPEIATENALMVGDREHDIYGAHAVNMRCAAVLFGYGNRAEFEEAGADYILDSVADLRNKLLA
jgi:phosphoglycolate phosphatase